jgi:hypothetical protein
VSDIKQFIQQLETITDGEVVDIFIPSVKKKGKFRALTVKQHKDIIKTVMEGFDGSIKTPITFNNILKENAIDKGLELKLYDRNHILVELRKATIGESVKIGDTTYDLKELPKFNFEFEGEPNIEYKNISVEMEIPSLEKDTQITEKSMFEFGKISSEEKKVKDSVNILLTFEIIKFIKQVKIGELVLSFDKLSLHEKKSIVDAFPLKLNNNIIDFISKYKEYEQSLLTFGDGTKLTIDASFLTSE